MQGLGFAAAIAPALEEIYGTDEGLKKGALKRSRLKAVDYCERVLRECAAKP